MARLFSRPTMFLRLFLTALCFNAVVGQLVTTTTPTTGGLSTDPPATTESTVGTSPTTTAAPITTPALTTPAITATTPATTTTVPTTTETTTTPPTTTVNTRTSVVVTTTPAATTDTTQAPTSTGSTTTSTTIITTPPGPSTTVPTTTEAPASGFNRTVVFIFKQTNPGQDLFLEGGIDHAHRPGCVTNAATSPCAIPITVESLGATAHYDKYNAWRVGDDKLDWYGAQPGQGTYVGQIASGTPMVWTSNLVTSPGYQPLNTFGDHYWMVDMQMDCSKGIQGWFELKSLIAPSGWESDIAQDAVCTGTTGGFTPYVTTNHVGRCGYINVFTYGRPSCQIDSF